MERILTITALLSVLLCSYGYAQMGHGIMRDTDGTMENEQAEEQVEMTEEQKEEKRKIEEQRKKAEEYRYMQHIRLMEEMRVITQEIVGTLDTLSGMINGITKLKEIPEERMRKIGLVMKDLGDEVDTVSGIMAKGKAGNEELRDLRRRIKETQKQMLKIIINTPR